MRCKHQNLAVHPAGGGYPVCLDCGAHGRRVLLSLLPGKQQKRPVDASIPQDEAANN